PPSHPNLPPTPPSTSISSPYSPTTPPQKSHRAPNNLVLPGIGCPRPAVGGCLGLGFSFSLGVSLTSWVWLPQAWSLCLGLGFLSPLFFLSELCALRDLCVIFLPLPTPSDLPNRLLIADISPLITENSQLRTPIPPTPQNLFLNSLSILSNVDPTNLLPGQVWPGGPLQERTLNVGEPARSAALCRTAPSLDPLRSRRFLRRPAHLRRRTRTAKSHR